jgi:hypothetical protein
MVRQATRSSRTDLISGASLPLKINVGSEILKLMDNNRQYLGEL